MKKAIAFALLAGLMGTAPAALSHLDEEEFLQSFRQSYFALLGATFGPMVAMAKGEMPWDGAMFGQLASEMAALGKISVTRGFPPGSEKGTTRAKPEIWDNKDDFESKFQDLVKELDALAEVAAGSDEDAMKKQLGQAGGACKACHDDYKSKDYLY